MEKYIIKILKKALKKKGVNVNEKKIEGLLEIPPSIEYGDYSFPCFFLAEKLKQEPDQIALEVREEITKFPETDLEDIQTEGGYINFFINRKELARKIVWESITQREKFGKTNAGKRKKIIVEFSSPNIAKPFGIGHLRSTIIGNSLSNIAEFQGYKPVKINYLGDWGTQFGKLIYGFEKFGREKKLEKNPIKHLLDIYVKVNKYKRYEGPSREAFKKLEQGDKKSKMLWKVFKDLSLEEFKKIYDELEIKFDEYRGESSSIKYVARLMKKLEEKKLLKKSKGALIVDLKKYGMGVCIIEKSDGASTYAARDLAEAIRRYEKYKFEKMFYCVGQEQSHYFKQIFKILELMGYKWVKNCVHISHGLYLDKDGKKLSTRKGKVFFMDDILKETKRLVETEIKKRVKRISGTELKERVSKIAKAAIFYGDLKNNRRNNIIFDLKKFTSFEGDTGPYMEYSYARATSILEKTKNTDKFEIKNLDEKELELVKKLLEFERLVTKSFETQNPSMIANYCYQTAKKFNEFYHACPVLNSESESFRLALVEAFRQIIRNALKLLGIETVKKM